MAVGKKPNTVAVVTSLAQPLAQEMNLSIWDIRFEKEGSSWFLRIFIESENGLTMDENEAFSRRISKLLDDADPIESSYYLEVGSPGIERELIKDTHFQQFIGSDVSVRLIRPINNVRDFTGELLSYEDGKIEIAIDEETAMTFQKSETAFVRLVDNYDYSQSEDEE